MERDLGSEQAATTGSHRVDQGAGGAGDQKQAEKKASLRVVGQIVIWIFLGLFVLAVLLAVVAALPYFLA